VCKEEMKFQQCRKDVDVCVPKSHLSQMTKRNRERMQEGSTEDSPLEDCFEDGVEEDGVSDDYFPVRARFVVDDDEMHIFRILWVSENMKEIHVGFKGEAYNTVEEFVEKAYSKIPKTPHLDSFDMVYESESGRWEPLDMEALSVFAHKDDSSAKGSSSDDVDLYSDSAFSNFPLLVYKILVEVGSSPLPYRINCVASSFELLEKIVCAECNLGVPDFSDFDVSIFDMEFQHLIEFPTKMINFPWLFKLLLTRKRLV